MSDDDDGPNLMTLLGLGAATAVILVLGMVLGWLVDAAFITFPAFTLAGMALGIVGSCVYIYGQFRKFLKE